MLRVLYLSLGNQEPMVKAWKSFGAEIHVYDFYSDFNKDKKQERINDNLISLAIKFNPDLIQLQNQFTGIILPGTLIKIRALLPNVKIVDWTGDCRIKPDENFIKLSQYTDFSLLSSSGQVGMYKAAGGKNIAYWQIGYDPDKHYPQNKNKFKYDIVFTGNHYGNFPGSSLRFSAVNELKNIYGNRFGLFGSGYPPKFNTKSVNMSELNDLYNNSRIILSISNFNDIGHYFSDRLLYALASGRPTISIRFPGIEDYFTHRENILIANNIAGIVDNVNFILKNEDLATNIGISGNRIVVREHTFRSRILELVDMLDLLEKL